MAAKTYAVGVTLRSIEKPTELAWPIDGPAAQPRPYVHVGLKAGQEVRLPIPKGFTTTSYLAGEVDEAEWKSWDGSPERGFVRRLRWVG